MTRPMHDASRRLFLKQTGALSALGAGSALATSLAASGAMAATGASDYKALVCLFMHGGNDAFNTVLATDEDSWANYTAVRNQRPDSIALLRNVAADRSQAFGSPAGLGGVLPIAPATAQAGRSFALHPMLTSAKSLFDRKRLAIVSNVGPLTEPLTKAEYFGGLKRRPKKLFSHNDQQSTWLALAPEGATVGWGGRLADALASGNGQGNFTAISVSGNSVWLSGQTVRQYQMSAKGPIRMGSEPDPKGIHRIFSSQEVGTALERIVTSSRSGHLMEADLASLGLRSITAQRILSGALPSAESAPFGPGGQLYFDAGAGRLFNPLAQQLQMIARTIAAQSALGMKRQVFFVSLGGYDTHNNQNRNHADLLAKLNHGLQYFDATLSALGMADRVTTFTASDFGRSFTSNGDGSDHGWGGHHLVMGGAVKGGDLHGSFPVLAAKNARDNGFDGSPDQLNNGVLLPLASVDQYGATLGNWFGLSASQLRDVFPNLANFSQPSLGFMKT